jgi:hypothetical protein
MLVEIGVAITMASVYTEVKFWLPLLTILGVLYKGFKWLQTKASKLEEIHIGVSELKGAVNLQTAQIVTEIKEQRSDFRAFIAPMYAVQLAKARPTRPRKDTKSTKDASNP